MSSTSSREPPHGDLTRVNTRRVILDAVDLPVFLSSGFTEQVARERLMDIPRVGFIQKPYTLDKLQEALSRLCPKSR